MVVVVLSWRDVRRPGRSRRLTVLADQVPSELAPMLSTLGSTERTPTLLRMPNYETTVYPV